MSWLTNVMRGGVYTPIRALVEAGTAELQVFGNSDDGWTVNLVEGDISLCVSPWFHKDFGDRRADCVAACVRHFGVKPRIVRELGKRPDPALDTSNEGVSLMTLSDGRLLMVEPEPHTKNLTRRCFHQMPDGALEWASYDDVQENGTRARFYGFASRELPATMRAGA